MKPAAVVAKMGTVPSLHSPERLYKNLGRETDREKDRVTGYNTVSAEEDSNL